MLPWAHLGLGYLLYSGWRRRDGRRPTGAAVIALVIATQAPDLVDKPLSWHLAVLPTGRSLAHSVFVAGAVAAAAWWVTRRYDRPRVGAAVAVGYWSHLLGDALWPLLAGDVGTVTTFLWPVAPSPASEHGMGILSFLLAVEPTPRIWAGIAVACVAAVAWVDDGCPGAVTATRTARRVAAR